MGYTNSQYAEILNVSVYTTKRLLSSKVMITRETGNLLCTCKSKKYIVQSFLVIRLAIHFLIAWLLYIFNSVVKLRFYNNL